MKKLDEYQEQKIKVLEVDVASLTKKLEEIGVKKVYEDTRKIIALDTKDRQFLTKKDKLSE